MIHGRLNTFRVESLQETGKKNSSLKGTEECTLAGVPYQWSVVKGPGGFGVLDKDVKRLVGP